MRITGQFHCVKESISFLLFLFILSACNEQQQAVIPVQNVKPVFLPPVTVLLDTMPAPKRVLLKNAPPPRVVNIPKTKGGTYILETESKKEQIQLSPPVIETNYKLSPHFTNFNSENGLAGDVITSGMLDQKGNLWFGTQGGVSKFDGSRFTNFSGIHGLASSSIRAMLEDERGNIWFASDGGGLSRYDGVRVTTYLKEHGLADNILLSAVKDKRGNLWFGTFHNGVIRYDGKKFTNFDSSHGLPSNNINALVEDSTGTLWFGTWGSGICRYEPDRKKGFQCFSTEQGLANNFINFIKPDSKGNLWIGTEGGLSRFDGKRFTNFTIEHGLPDNIVMCMEEYDGDIWFGTFGGGVSRFDGIQFDTFTTEQGLSNNSIWTILKDQQNKLWIGTQGGLSRYNGKAISIISSGKALSKNPVFGVTQDLSGSLWFASWGSGVFRYDGRSMINFTTSQGLGSNSIKCVSLDKTGKIWFGTETGGISVYNPDGLTGFKTFTTAQGLVSNSVSCILPDTKGCLWLATSNGVCRFEPNGDSSGFTSYTTEQGLAHNLVNCIEEGKDGSIWFSTQGGGVSRFDGKRFTTFNTSQGLAGNLVMKIVRDRSGNMWFGTQTGLSRFDGSGFISYTTKDGLADNYIYDIDEDEKGVLWVGTNLGLTGLKFKQPPNVNQSRETKGAGLITVSNEELKDYEPQWDIYNIKTGYLIKDLNGQAMYITRQRLPYGSPNDTGIIWGAAGDKVFRFDPKAVVKNSKPPIVFIRSVGIDESAVNWYGISQKEKDSMLIAHQEAMVFGNLLPAMMRDSLQQKFGDIRFDSITPYYQVPQNLVLPYRHNRVNFDFGAIETSRPFMVRYQYFLEGYDKDWSPVTDKTTASFGKISEGSYCFNVKAMSPEGVWSEPITYSFKVLPPWYRTWWAYLSYLGLFSFLMYSIFQWRTKSLKLEKLKLEEKVSQRTTELEHKSIELEQSLTNLKATQSQLVQSEKMASLGELTAGIAHEIQNPLNFVNNFSEVSSELVAELKAELKSGNIAVAIDITDDIDQNLGKINHHGKRADAIVKGMLQHSRTSTGVKEPTNINILADEYLRLSFQGMRAKDKNFNATLQTDFDETLGQINIIPQDIGRVLLNLYNNAFYAVTEKKKQQGDDYEPIIFVSTKKISKTVEIRVKDNGNGILEKIKEKIFQPFFTTKPTGQGTGLGLSLSYDIVKAHGGEIIVESKEGEGSAFTILLPST